MTDTLSVAREILVQDQHPLSTGYLVATVRDLPRNSAPHASGRLRVYRDATRDLWVGTLPTSKPPLEAQTLPTSFTPRITGTVSIHPWGVDKVTRVP